MKNKKGMIFIEVLVGVIAYAMLLLVMVQLLRVLLNSYIPHDYRAFEFAIKQLQWQIAIENDLYFEDDKYCFAYEGNQRCLNISNKRLYLTPGTQIILNDYESLRLFESDAYLWIAATREGESYEAIIWEIGP